MGNTIDCDISRMSSDEIIAKLKAKSNRASEEINELYTSFLEECAVEKTTCIPSINNIKDQPKMDKDQFIRFYARTRGFQTERIENVAKELFRVFDENCDKKIDFHEFMLCYIITNYSETDEMLQYLFKLYDINDDGVIKKSELGKILEKMLVFLNINEGKDNLKRLTETIFAYLSQNKSDTIDVEQFTKGLLDNQTFRFYLSPFKGHS